jgi:hypothetical protein
VIRPSPLVWGSVLLGILLAGALAGWWWGRTEVHVELRDVQPPICTQSVRDQRCGDGVIVARTVTGGDEVFRYGSDIDVTSLPPGTPVLLTISWRTGKVTKVQVVERS